jgi:transcriptional regulator with XRE-family HTH domain
MRKNNAYLDTISMHDELFDGKVLQKLQKEKSISVSALGRLTGLSRTVIYRAFNNQSIKSYRILIRIALDRPEDFVY